MRCKKCKASIYDVLDGRTTESAEDEIRRHLDSCPACRAAFEEERKIGPAIKEAIERRMSGLRFHFRTENQDVRSGAPIDGGKIPASRPASPWLRPVRTAAFVLGFALLAVLLRFAFFRPVTVAEAAAVEDPRDLMTDPLDDWMNRRLIITISDDRGRTEEHILTAKSEEASIRIPYQRKSK